MNFPIIDKPPKSKREAAARVYLQPGEVPVGALTWRSKKDKPHHLRRWRRGVGKSFEKQPRVIRLAWCLEWLFGEDGYAYPSNGFLERETDISANKIQESLALLESNGGIVRVYASENGRVQRRLYPGAAIADQATPDVGGEDTPDAMPNPPPTSGTHKRNNYNRDSSAERFISRSSTLNYAAATAHANDVRRATGDYGTT